MKTKTKPAKSKAKKTTRSTTSWALRLAKKHEVSEGAVAEFYAALQRGGGGMAQFSHPDLGGSGQWMKSGMIMVGDMFNDTLKRRVDALGRDLAAQLDRTEEIEEPEKVSPLKRAGSPELESWWPSEYRTPSATGAQNDFRYAYFPRDQALVIERGGKTSIYDTTGHEFHGFGQQQSARSGFAMRSAKGDVPLSKLPIRRRR